MIIIINTLLLTEHIEDIVSLAFQYINMLKKEGVKEWIYKECQVCLCVSGCVFAFVCFHANKDI